MSASKLVSVKDLLEKSGSPLAKISGKAALLEELTIFIRQALPDPLKNHLIAASEHDSTLVLTADSGIDTGGPMGGLFTLVTVHRHNSFLTPATAGGKMG